jgi:1,4-dihydroxy-2-naphthoyl-CoA hydrolase
MTQTEGRAGTDDGALDRMLELMTSASKGELTEAQTAELSGIFESSIPSWTVRWDCGTSNSFPRWSWS